MRLIKKLLPLPISQFTVPLKTPFFALLAGALHALSFAPWPLERFSLAPRPLWWLQLLTLAVLAALLRHAPTARRAALLGFIFGLGWFGVGVSWTFISLHTYGGMHWALASAGVALFCAYLALHPALAAWLCVRLSRAWHASLPTASPAASPATASAAVLPSSSRPALAFELAFIFLFAFAWGSSEWLRATLFTGFPWIASAYAHVQGGLAGYVPIVGISGVNLLAALAAALLATGLRYFRFAQLFHRRTALTSGLLAGSCVVLLISAGLLQRVTWTSPSGRTLSVRLVQGNVVQNLKFDPQHLAEQFQRYYQLTTQTTTPTNPTAATNLVANFPDLIVLPETALPVPMQHAPAGFFQALSDFSRATGSTVLTGIPLLEARPTGTALGSMGAVDWYNGALAITPQNTPALAEHQALPHYAKHHLVPFGETIPPGFAWFVQAMNIPLGEFGRGAAVQAPFVVKDQRIAVNICYEDLFGNEIAATLRQPQPPTVLLNLSNLAWFGNSLALPQHLLASRARALETGRPLLRATNTGVTAVITPQGEVTQQLPVQQTGTLSAHVQGYHGSTPYLRWGDAGFALLSALTLGAALGLGRWVGTLLRKSRYKSGPLQRSY